MFWDIFRIALFAVVIFAFFITENMALLITNMSLL